jgi:hypothetical protein
MARQVAQPKADQPRATSVDTKLARQPAQLEYRIQGVKTFNRSPSTRSYGRSDRG